MEPTSTATKLRGTCFKGLAHTAATTKYGNGQSKTTWCVAPPPFEISMSVYATARLIMTTGVELYLYLNTSIIAVVK